MTAPGKHTPAQRRMLHHINVWGECGPDAEDEVRLWGAAFEAVLKAVERNGLICHVPGVGSGSWELTEAGQVAISKATGDAK